ncbi:MAG: hypothetical protein ACNI27_07435 [Desulfovibrio sp.]
MLPKNFDDVRRLLLKGREELDDMVMAFAWDAVEDEEDVLWLEAYEVSDLVYRRIMERVPDEMERVAYRVLAA